MSEIATSAMNKNSLLYAVKYEPKNEGPACVDNRGEKIQNTVETIKSNMEISNSGRRPYLSLNGPKKICPIANPIILDVSPSCTIDEFVSKYPVIVGRLGKYISVTKGPKAVRAPNKINKNALELFSFIYYLLLIKNHCKITKNVLSVRRICYLC